MPSEIFHQTLNHKFELFSFEDVYDCFTVIEHYGNIKNAMI